MDQESLERLETLRQRVFEILSKLLAVDGYCKSYEGTFHITFPNYFHEKYGYKNGYRLGFDCYLLGPHRHEIWEGDSLSDCLDKAERSINEWINDAESWIKVVTEEDNDY